MLFILISVTSQVFHQPQLVAEAAAYGPHPEFLSHCKDAWLHVVGLITLADCLIDISVYPPEFFGCKIVHCVCIQVY